MHFHRKFPTGKEGHLSKIALIPRNFPVERPQNVCLISISLPEFPEFLDKWKAPKTTIFFFFSWTSIQSFGKICRIERDGIDAIKFEAARTHFLGDVFV